MNRRTFSTSGGSALTMLLANQARSFAAPATPASATPEVEGTGLVDTTAGVLPKGTAGVLEVVAQDDPQNREIGVIVHNGTDHAATIDPVIAAGYGKNGGLLVVGQSHGVVPTTIPAGDYGIASLNFTGDVDATMKLELVATEATMPVPSIDLAVTNVKISGSEISGTVQNTSTKDVSMPSVQVVFLDTTGSIAGRASIYLRESNLPAGESADFSDQVYKGHPTENYLLGATGIAM